MKKTTFQAGKVGIRLLVGTDTKGLDPSPHVAQLAGTFGSFSLGEGNQFVFKKAILFKDKLIERIKNRTLSYFERKNQILNSQELASMWHPPGILMAGIKNIAWGKTMQGEPPENLPVVDEKATEETKKTVNFSQRQNSKIKRRYSASKTRTAGNISTSSEKQAPGSRPSLPIWQLTISEKAAGLGLLILMEIFLRRFLIIFPKEG